MGMADEMRRKLEAAFAPERLEIRDDSERHRGHAGYQEGGESHWFVAIAAPAFSEMSRIERHRAVHSALGPEIVGRIHALQLKIEA
ncbi:BolA family protein [Ovoidimarina sediminis]|uniref:BolA family protein n=1 Tax=Ovoidimarina sediminis TaxID=3079856 RepID=UPI002909A4BE|nr:BolA family protein [Rhodophyticola sp. MJ-SS7]MDU8944900.1 BolA family protein [Rhodophyticola sp. MJ-SS7]